METGRRVNGFAILIEIITDQLGTDHNRTD